MGLQRVSRVADRAQLLAGLPKLITVAGTNGKGSVVAMLNAVYLTAGYRVGSYTSPHISRFNERICIDSEMVSDRQIVDALCWVETHRGEDTLTYFEFTTLAAMRIYTVEKLDVVILEVGLGGRLDAVNIWDTDCAAITSIAVDHESWLGSDKNTIAREKVGIARTLTPLVVGDNEPPSSLLEHAQAIDAQLWQIGQDFHYRPINANQWQLTLPDRKVLLSPPALTGAHQYNNAATALACVEALQSVLPVSDNALSSGLMNAHLAGRFELRCIEGLEIIIDVAHNPAAAEALSRSLQEVMQDRKAHAVFGIMSDKDIDSVVSIVAPCVATWHCGQLDVPRALPATELTAMLAHAGIHGDDCRSYASVASAFSAAQERARQSESDYVLVFGSFFTVTAAIELMDPTCH